MDEETGTWEACPESPNSRAIETSLKPSSPDHRPHALANMPHRQLLHNMPQHATSQQGEGVLLLLQFPLAALSHASRLRVPAPLLLACTPCRHLQRSLIQELVRLPSVARPGRIISRVTGSSGGARSPGIGAGVQGRGGWLLPSPSPVMLTPLEPVFVEIAKVSTPAHKGLFSFHVASWRKTPRRRETCVGSVR